jgi:hypothetical protein
MQNIDKIDLKLNAGNEAKATRFRYQSFQVINDQDAFFLTSCF